MADGGRTAIPAACDQLHSGLSVLVPLMFCHFFRRKGCACMRRIDSKRTSPPPPPPPHDRLFCRAGRLFSLVDVVLVLRSHVPAHHYRHPLQSACVSARHHVGGLFLGFVRHRHFQLAAGAPDNSAGSRTTVPRERQPRRQSSERRAPPAGIGNTSGGESSDGDGARGSSSGRSLSVAARGVLAYSVRLRLGVA